MPARVSKDSDGNYSFIVKDPEDHSSRVRGVRERLASVETSAKASRTERISDHMLHVGVHVKSPEAQDKFYKDILGFRFQWKGGPRTIASIGFR